MSLKENEFPIMEYDDNPKAVVEPNHEMIDIKLPEKAVFAFVGDIIDRFAQEQNLTKMAEFVSITKSYPIYIYNYRGAEICICQAPVGAPAAVQIMDWLIGYGVKVIVSAGSCGVLEDIPENNFLIPVKALRDEGTSYHYLRPARFVDLNPKMVAMIERVLEEKEIPFQECITWSTDGFFRETADKVNHRKKEGCSVVEMECAALAACAEFRGIEFGQILFTADSLAAIDSHDSRS